MKPLPTKQLAVAAGVTAQTIRKLERRGYLRCTRNYCGWRMFAPSEVDTLRRLLGWACLTEASDSSSKRHS
jgi:DNA-binding transcriptional MerR regulator